MESQAYLPVLSFAPLGWLDGPAGRGTCPDSKPESNAQEHVMEGENQLPKVVL